MNPNKAKTTLTAESENSSVEFFFASEKQGTPRAILSTKKSGSMRFENTKQNPHRQNFFSKLGIAEKKVISLELHHTQSVLTVRNEKDAALVQSRAKQIHGADGILCSDSEFVLALTVADCMPIWIYESQQKVFGLLHSGWKGTGILAVALEKLLQEWKADPASISLIFGPCIGSCCYSVEEARAEYFSKLFGENSVRRAVSKVGTPEFYLDLAGANREIAKKYAVTDYMVIDQCTACSPLLGSFRREGPENFTRMLALCGRF